MTNEIKEILKRFNEFLKGGNYTVLIMNLTKNEVKTLLDYITNLQEEKENAVECLKYYEEKHFIKPAVDNTKLTIDLYNAYLKEINDLQQRIDKAVEYIMTELITDWDIQNDGNVSGSDLPAYAITPILDILRGDE